MTLAGSTSCRTQHTSLEQETVEGRPPHAAGHTSAPQLAKREGALWYRIVPHKEALHITLRLMRPPRQLSLFLPGAWAGQDDWAARIRIKQARTPQGQRPITLQRHLGRLDIDAGETRPWIELSYEVSLTERKHPMARFAPQKLPRSTDFFAYAPTILILPSERLANSMIKIPVEIITPKDAQLITTWTPSHDAPSSQDESLHVYGFVVPDVRALRDAFLLLSGDIKLEQRSESLDIAYDARFSGSQPDFSEFIARTLDTYQASFGPATPHTTALIRTPAGYDSSSQRWGTGRRGGFVLELEEDATLDRSAHILIAHEAFHLWNGHLLVPQADTEQTTRWFKEGLTHYVALKSLYEQGVLTERELLHEIAQAASRYADAHANHRLASKREALPLYAYDKGLLLAMSLDQMLAHASSGRHHLTHWLQNLLERAQREPDWRYAPEDLMKSLEHEFKGSSLDFATWRRHCEDTQPIKLDTFFGDMGLHWLGAESGRTSKLIPLDDTKDASWKMTLSPPTTTP